MLQQMTNATINWINGKNGTGQPSYVVNISAHLQGLGDAIATPFLNQIANNLNSPFGTTIAAALQKSYGLQTSMGGFLAANQCTLMAGKAGIPASANIPAYLAGNWSQGGISAWFALTTQSQNNPYMLYQNSQAQLGSVIMSATQARLAELNWGSGFMSWCSVSDSATQTQNAASTAYQTCMANGGNGDTCQATFENSGGLMTAVGINPGDACTNSDGSTGTIQTPGSTIKATLDKVLGGQQDKLAQMGNVAGQITSILSNIAQIYNTVQFASSILGGSSSGGLLNASQPSGALSSFGAPTIDPKTGNITSNYVGASQTSVYQTAAGSGASGPDLLGLVARYETSWATITSSANTASANVTTLINVCTTNIAAAKAQLNQNPTLQAFIDAATAQISAAQSALTNVVAPITSQATTASVIITNARAAVAKVQSESVASASTYPADVQALQSLPPTAIDVANAFQQSQALGNASSTPVGSLNVSGVSYVDKLNLISTNATMLESTVCNPSSSLYVSSSNSGA